jgi:hypothetical protein
MLNPFSTQQDRERLKDVWNEDVIAQGECGSCYAVSSMYTLQSRANLYLHKTRKNSVSRQNTGLRTSSWQLYLPELSIQDALWCSIYNQGCFGGYPFLIGKVLLEEIFLYTLLFFVCSILMRMAYLCIHVLMKTTRL